MIVKDQLKLDALERELAALKERHFALQERYEERMVELTAAKATAEDYRKQACRPDDCRIMDRLRKANAKLEVAVGALPYALEAMIDYGASKPRVDKVREYIKQIEAIERGE
jgi:hypothetical protein